MKENQTVLLLGGNIGDRKAILKQALERLELNLGNLIQLSSIYETEAWGNKNQDSFYNQVAVFETSYSAQRVLEIILQIETELGRKRTEKWGSRTIDIDILFYNNEIITEESLEIPHPFLHLRKFTLVPLDEIMPNYVHPRLNQSIRTLRNLMESEDLLIVKKI